MATTHLQDVNADEYIPQSTDSALAHTRPISSFLEYFKQSLTYQSSYCTDSQCCTFPRSDPDLHNGNNYALLEQGNDEVTYPLVLFEKINDLPRVEVLQYLAQQARANILTHIPFIQSLMCMKASLDETPLYLLLPQVLLGAISSKEQQHKDAVAKLWLASTSLATGNVEVDNTLGRMVPWHLAAILITVYGFLQCDDNIWRQTEIISGYAGSTLYRPGFVICSNDKAHMTTSRLSPVMTDVFNLKKLYFIVDTLRSIHFLTPSSVEPGWSIFLGQDRKTDFRASYNSMVLGSKPPPQSLSTEDYYLFLFNILADINGAFGSVGELTTEYTLVRERLLKMCSRPMQGNDFSLPKDDVRDAPCSPPVRFIPLSADHELARIQAKLASALRQWKGAFISHVGASSQHHGGMKSTIWPMFHLARLLLDCGPTVYILPSLVGYLPREYDRFNLDHSQPIEPHSVGITMKSSVLQVALDILESIDSDDSNIIERANRQSSTGKPFWFALAAFYASLVTWHHACLPATSSPASTDASTNPLFTPRRLLRKLQREILSMTDDWDCASSMAAVISRMFA